MRHAAIIVGEMLIVTPGQMVRGDVLFDTGYEFVSYWPLTGTMLIRCTWGNRTHASVRAGARTQFRVFRED